MDEHDLAPPETEALGPDSRRWLRDLGALLALPSMWVDHEPREIAEGLLSVLEGTLDLDASYVRFEASGDEDPLEVWRPGDALAAEFSSPAASDDLPAGASTVTVDRGEFGTTRVTRLPLTLPWERGVVLVSSTRPQFPTTMETHLLRVAAGQASIAIHTARRLLREREARVRAERMLQAQTVALRVLVDEIGPALGSASVAIEEAARAVATAEASRPGIAPSWGPSAPVNSASADPSPVPRLTRREAEVLGMLAQGLSNKEIAGVMWLSDRTVERHVTSLYRKIGVARRSEATAFALRHGLA